MLIVILQAASGAYHAEFGNDEAAHYVSGLMVHDYLKGGLETSPRDFLQNYHSHYPVIGIGHWPPFYYLVEAVWMLFFGISRTAVLALSAAGTFVVGIVLYRFLEQRYAAMAAGVAAVIFCVSLVVQENTNTLMIDIPLTLVCLLAMLSYVRYLNSGQIRDSVIFAILAVAAIMMKGNGASLALLPPCAVLIGRRFDLLRKLSFWIPVPIVGVLTAPWYLYTYQSTSRGFRYSWGLDYLSASNVANAQLLLFYLGPVVIALALLGFVKVILRGHKTPLDAGLVGAGSLFTAVWAFQSLVPAALEPRYLLPLVPPLLILSVHGLSIIWEWLRGFKPSINSWRLIAVLLFLASFLISSWGIATKSSFGVIQAVQQIDEHTTSTNQTVLIAMDSSLEPAAVAEIAMADNNRPLFFAIRGSRLLGGGGFNNFQYIPRFQTVAEVMGAIDEYNIPLILLRNDGNPKNWEHIRRIEQAMVLFPERFQVISKLEGKETPIRLVRVRGNETKPADIDKLLALSAPRALAIK